MPRPRPSGIARGGPLAPDEQTFGQEGIDWPWVVESTETSGSPGSLPAYCAAERASLSRRLTRRGALLFRGFDVRSTETFRQALSALGIEPSPFPYAGNTLREPTGPEVFEVTDAPSWTSIFPHHEMFYWFRQPRTISFFCEANGGTHGETPIVDTRRVWRALPSELRRRLLDARFSVTSRYSSQESGARNPLSPGRQLANTWQAVGSGADRPAFTEHVAEGGGTVEWRRRDTALVTVDNALVVRHPDNGVECFRGLGLYSIESTRMFNRLVRARLDLGSRWKSLGADLLLAAASRLYRGIRLTSGRLTREDMRVALEAVADNTSCFRWRPGDVLVVDNIAMAHGRLDVNGPRALHALLGGEVWMRDLDPRTGSEAPGRESSKP